MRVRYFFALVCLLSVFEPTAAAAYFYNDSEVIEVGNGVPKNVVTPVTEGGYITPPLSDDPPPPPPIAPEIPPAVPILIDSTIGYVPPAPGDPPRVPILDTNAFDLLLESGAIIGGELVTASSFFEDSLLASLGQSLFGKGSVLIYGSRVRDALRRSYNLQDVLEAWRAGRSGALTARGYGLVAASTALRDGNVQSVSFSADAFEITYRSRGYLFSIFPLSFPVRITIVPEASERVSVHLPWYRFFVREFFTPQSLSSEIDALIVQEIQKNTKPESDLKAVLFEAVAQFLKKKVGTISDTVYLGTQEP